MNVPVIRARGTWKRGFMVSPEGMVMTSNPPNANASKKSDRMRFPYAGRVPDARLAASILNNPPAMINRSGSTFATVIRSNVSAPYFTPRTLMSASVPVRMSSVTIFVQPCPAAGRKSARYETKRLQLAAVAAIRVMYTSQPT